MGPESAARAACLRSRPHGETGVALPFVPTQRALTPEQETLLFEHLPAVRSIARAVHRRLPPSVDLEDLVSAGILGLMDALNRFNPDQNTAFGVFARFRIRGAMQDSLRLLDWGPRFLRRKGRSAQDAIHALTARLHRPPEEPEIAAELDLTLQQYQRLRSQLDRLRLSPLAVDDRDASTGVRPDSIPAPPQHDPLFLCLQNELRDRLGCLVADLPRRERLLVTLYYYEEMSLTEISLVLGVKPARVSRMHNSALRRLRGALRSRRAMNDQRVA